VSCHTLFLFGYSLLILSLFGLEFVVDWATVVSEAVTTALKQHFGSPLVQSTGTHSRDDEAKLGGARHLPANFTFSGHDVVATEYPSYDLTARQLNRTEQFKYFTALKQGVRDRFGENRYAVTKSRRHMFITDGTRRVFKCSLANHHLRCAYLELLGLDFDISAFLGEIGQKSGDEYHAMKSPDFI
jgi:hypothetical protein